MAIRDKVKRAWGALGDKFQDTFGDPTDYDGLDGAQDAEDEEDADARGLPALDVVAARALLGLGEGATLADVREAYTARAKEVHPRAVRDGFDSEAQRALDRLLEALELLEEDLVPLAGSAGVTPRASPPPPARKRATARKR